MKTRLLRKWTPILLTILFCIISIISLTTMTHMQGNARAVNFAGIVRGATQQLVKQEMHGVPNDELILYLDEIIVGLSVGNQEQGLTALPDTAFQDLITQLRQSWDQIKKEIQRVRRGANVEPLFDLSEAYFDLANRAVSAAEQYSENQVKHAKRILIYLNLCFIFLAVLFWLYGRRQKKVESALNMAENASLAKSEFLSRMSHEIRTPLNGIIGMTEIAQLDPEDRDRLDDCLQKIGMSSKYLLALINDILDMSRIESGKIQLEHRVFDIKLMLDQIYGMFQQKSEESGVDFRIVYGSLTVSTVIGDDVRLSQVLVNMVSNALKFTPSGGTVSLEARQKEVGEQSLSLEFIVSDTGIGISEEFLSRIFEPFEQEQASGRQYGGTGLGLAISKNFVKMMGGQLSVQSKPGEGSRFTVNLTLQRPLKEDAEKQGALHSDSSAELHCLEYPDLTGARILLAEDIDINAEIVTVLLQNEGAHVDLARNGKEAVERFGASPGDFTLILMDIQMPILDGLQATRLIRNMRVPHADTIPIIGLSANAFREDIEKALDSGMNGYLSKPIDRRKLIETMCKYHDKRE